MVHFAVSYVSLPVAIPFVFVKCINDSRPRLVIYRPGTASKRPGGTWKVAVVVFFLIKMVVQGVIKLPILVGIKQCKQCKSMVIFRDFPKIIVHCLGWCHITTPVLTNLFLGL